MAERPSNEDLARDAYKNGLELYEAGQREQALIEFQRAQELAPRPANLVMMGNCEYHLGFFKKAREHYLEYLRYESTGQLAESARQRIDAINRRKAVLSINSQPPEVDILLERLDGPPGEQGAVITGQAPQNFPVTAGRWRVTARRPRYVTETRDVTVESVDTVPMFFALEQQRGKLEVRTAPRQATLYVRGNRARNPYVQEVDPGAYEIYAEATNHEPRTETYFVAPGEHRLIDFRLRYVQRSGVPELIGFWTAAGAVGVAGLVRARLSSDESVTASTTVVGGGALVGGVAGALISTALVPDYLPDNLALLRIGAAWIGAVEGSTIALTFRESLLSGWVGGAIGLGAGAVAGPLLDSRAPNYGRVAIIQSGAAIGALGGALTVPAFTVVRDGKEEPLVPPSLAVFGGLNLGLAAGLALAYLPDMPANRPTWRRVMLIDLATAAGATGGALVNIFANCIGPDRDADCSFRSDDSEVRKRIARSALVGGGVGLVAGWLLTLDYDRERSTPASPTSTSFLTLPTLLPVEGADGVTRTVPGLAAAGRF